MTLTNQEVFNRVIGHILIQGYGYDHEEGQCTYLGAEGRSCGVGLFMDPEDADFMNNVEVYNFTSPSLVDVVGDLKWLDDGEWSEIKKENAETARGIIAKLPGSLYLLQDIQSAHDGNHSKPFASFLKEMHRIAGKHELEMPKGTEL